MTLRFLRGAIHLAPAGAAWCTRVEGRCERDRRRELVDGQRPGGFVIG